MNLLKEIAVEINGVYHYARNSELPLGKDIIKRKLLTNLNYEVITIPYYDWAILELEMR